MDGTNRRRVVLALGLLAAAACKPPRAPVGDVPETPPFAFGWAPADRAVVHTISARTRTADRTTGPLPDDPAPDLALVVRAGTAAERIVDAAWATEGVGAVLRARYPFAVGADGAYVGLAAPAQAMAAFGADPASPEAADLAAFLDTANRAEWDALAMLQGASSAPGTELSGERPLEMGIDSTWIVPAPTGVTVGNRVPCGAGGPVDCVEVTIHAARADRAVHPVSQDRRWALAAGPWAYEVERNEVLVIRPGDLRPFARRIERTLWREGRDADGGPVWEWTESRRSTCWAWDLASDDRAEAQDCAPPPLPVERPPRERRPVTVAATATHEPLEDVLAREVGAGGPVAILPGSALRAVSANGARQRTLAPGPVDWALVDPRADVVWFGGGGEVRLVDLSGTGEVERITGVLPGTSIGAPKVAVVYADGMGQTAGNGYWPRVVVVLGGRPALSSEVGYLGQWDQGEDFAAAVAQVKLVDPARLVALAARARPAPTAPPSSEGRVAVDPAACPGDPSVCGWSQSLAQTGLLRVATGYECGDGCFASYTLYDPAARAFLAPAWAAGLGEMWIAPDGSGFIAEGALVRFDSGPVVTGGETVADGGGWLAGGAYYPR